MKNRKGSVLIIVILIFVVFSILATTVLNLMLINKKQAITHKDKIKAYYIARSGAQAVEAKLGSMNDEKLNTINSILESGEIKMNIKLKDAEKDYLDNNSLKVILRKNGEETYSYLLESNGNFNGSSEIVEKSLSKESSSNSNGGPFGDVIEYKDGKVIINGEEYIILDNKYTSGKEKNIINGNKFEDKKKYFYECDEGEELIINLNKEMKSHIYVIGSVKIFPGNNDEIKISEGSKITATGDITIDGVGSKPKKPQNISIEETEFKSGGNIILKTGKDNEIKLDESIIEAHNNILLQAGLEGKIEVKDTTIKSKNIDIIAGREGEINVDESIIETSSFKIFQEKNGNQNIVKEFNQPGNIKYSYEDDDYEVKIEDSKLIEYKDDSSNGSNDGNKSDDGFNSQFK